MGCGESKLAVATSNTILRRKKSNVDGDQSSKKSKDIETVEKANTTAEIANGANSPMEQQGDHKKSDEVKEDNINNNIVNVKDINVNDEDGDKDNKEEQHDEAAERLISQGSPSRFFSSRKLDEEGIDGIISDGRSGTSDYFTPRHGPRNLHFKVDDDIAEDAQELDNQNLALPAETKAPETEKNEEPVKAEENLVREVEVAVAETTVKAEENLVKEVEVAVAETSTNIEDKVASPAEEEKK